MTLEPWLRSPLPNIVEELQPVAAMFIAAKEDIVRATESMSAEALWNKNHGAATIGFHVLHLAGATDRLLTYAEGGELTDEQKNQLIAERNANETHPSPDEVRAKLVETMDNAVRRLEGLTTQALSTPRELGRAKVPTTMRALILHAGEHAARHAGQIVTTAIIVSGGARV